MMGNHFFVSLKNKKIPLIFYKISIKLKKLKYNIYFKNKKNRKEKRKGSNLCN